MPNQLETVNRTNLPVKRNKELLRRVMRKMISPEDEEEDVRNELVQNAMEEVINKLDGPTTRTILQIIR